MAVSGPPVAEVAGLMARLAEVYTIGGAADAAGVVGGKDIQIATADYLAELASRHSFVDLAITSGIPAESAFAAVALRFVAAARTYLGTAGRNLLGWMAKNPNTVIAAGAVAGAVGVTYSWLTMDERTELARLEQVSETLRLTFNQLPQEQRARAFAVMAGAMAPRSELSNWILLAIAAGIGVWVWRTWQE